MQTNDIVRFTLKQILFGQEVRNVFYYRVQQAGGPSGFTLVDFIPVYAQRFFDQVMQFLSGDLYLNSVLYENLTDIDEFYEGTVSHSGAGALNAFSPQSALTVKLLRSNKQTRSGSKRFAGIAEQSVTNGVINFPQSTIDLIETFCGELLVLPEYVGSPEDVILDPVIVGRTKNASGVYELDLSKINPISSAEVQLNVSTQNTRKK